jgi:hypothetical protein
MPAIDEVLPLGRGVPFPRSIQIAGICIFVREFAREGDAELEELSR